MTSWLFKHMQAVKVIIMPTQMRRVHQSRLRNKFLKLKILALLGGQ